MFIKALARRAYLATAPEDSYFRAAAGFVIVNQDNKCLMLERSDVRGSFQFSQGGLDLDEEVQSGALRELFEETCITFNQITILGEVRPWLSYEVPKESIVGQTFRGQTLKWYVARLKDGVEVDISQASHPEFKSFKWIPSSEVVSHIHKIKNDMYIELMDHVQTILDHEKV
jgi:putative (di)nucleoside polyphosphate hydrolase